VSRQRPLPSLTALAYAALGARVACDDVTDPEAEWLRAAVRAAPMPLAPAVERAIRTPSADGRALIALANALGLSAPEILAVVLTAAIEDDVMAGRAVAYAQAPVGGSRPTLGLLAEVFGAFAESRKLSPSELSRGAAVASGLLTLQNPDAPCSERAALVPLATNLALNGIEVDWPGGRIASAPALVLPDSVLARAKDLAVALAAPNSALVIRSASLTEARAVAHSVIGALDRRAYWADNPEPSGFAAWLRLCQRVPVFAIDLAPGELRPLPVVPRYEGPIIVLTGLDGAFDAGGAALTTFRVGLPNAEERRALWLHATGEAALADELSRTHRQGAEHIAQLARSAAQLARAAGRPGALTARDVQEASRSGEGSGLDALAQLMVEPVPDEALVLKPELRAELERLLARCRLRDGLASELGVAAQTRYSPGIRALLCGPSGTGKTLAVGWLATRLGVPLYRVDLASITSKYIGETEKNLARLLGRAEQSEAILLFDEADSLFGKRTDVKDANDRFANAQTNYLLQRLETFEGVAVLTSNSRARFDAAFARRLDVIIELSQPAPEQRRALWEAHLGEHALSPSELGLLATQCDFAGGQIRNAVLAAAAAARHAGARIDWPHVLEAVLAEHKKSNKPPPPSLTAFMTIAGGGVS
jgi:hypothetical protein